MKINNNKHDDDENKKKIDTSEPKNMSDQSEPKPDNQNDSDEPSEENEEHSIRKWWWLGVLLLVGLAVFMLLPKHNDKKKATTESSSSSQVMSSSSSKVSVSSSSQSASSSSASSSSSSEKTVKNTVDMVPRIQKFFTAYQQYSTTKYDNRDRAKGMKEYATDDAVAALIPKNLQTSPSQESVLAAYKLQSEPEVQKVSGQDNQYTVVLKYRVTVANNHSDHVDSYMVYTSNNKITSAVQQSATTN